MKKYWLLFISLVSIFTSCPAAPTITAVKVNSALSNVAALQNTVINAEVVGTGAFDPRVDWSFTPNLGNISAQSDTQATYTASLISSDTNVVIRATSKADPSKFGETTLQLKAPIITNMTLGASQRTLASGTGYSTINVTTNGTGAVQNAVTWEISSGGGTLTDITDTNVKYNAPSVTQDTIVTIKATNKLETSKTDTITLIVIAPTTVNGVTIAASPNIIKSNATTTLAATVSGTGNPNPNAQWEIVSGGGTLSSVTGASVTYAPPVVTTDTTITIKASSSDDPSKTGTTQIVVEPIPTITGISVAAPQTTLQAQSTTNLSASVTGYGNADLGVKWTVVGNQGTLSNATGATTIFNAPNVTTITKIQVRAESVQDSRQFTLTEITINPKPVIEVTTTPATATVKATQKLVLTGGVTNATNQNLTWTVVSGGGTVTPMNSTGAQAEYTAPNVTSDVTAVIRATSVQDSSKTSTSTIAIKAPVLTLEVVWLDFRYLDSAGYSFSGSTVSVPLGGVFRVLTKKDGETVTTPVNFNIADTTIAMIHGTNGVGLAFINGIKANSSTTLTASVDGLQTSLTVNVGLVQIQKPTTMYPSWSGMSFVRPDGLYGLGDSTGMGIGLNGTGGDLNPPLKLPVPATIIGGSGGYNHNIALSNTGLVYGTGNQENGTGAYQDKWVYTGISGIGLTVGNYQTNYFVSNDAERRVYSNGANYKGQACQGGSPSQGLTGYGFTGGSGAYRLFAGRTHVMLIGATGQLWTCGSNEFGELGRGGTGDPLTGWAQALRVPSVIECTGADGTSACVTPSRNLVVWGRQNFGQFGLGHSDRVDVPVYAPVGGVLDAKCNGEMCILRTWDGEIWGAGKLEGFGLPQNIYYSWVRIPTQTQVTDIVVSEYRKLFVRTATDKYYGRGNNVASELSFAPPNIYVEMNTTNVTLRQGDNNTLLIATAQGTSFSKVNFASENTSIVDVEPTYVEGHHDSAIKLYWKGGGTTRVIAQSALGGTPTYITVTSVGNDLPQIKRFYELNGNLNPNPWDSLKLKWEIWDPNGDGMTCKLDLDDNGTWDHIQNNCNDTHEYTHLWNPTQAGARRIKLRVEDSRGGSTEAYLGFVVQSTNQAPTISSFTVTPSSGTAPITVTYTWAVSDPDGDATTCQLDADGDGTYEYSYPCSSRSSQTHTFNSNGSYTSRFKVTDGRGGVESASRVVSVGGGTTPNPISNNRPPVIRFFSPQQDYFSFSPSSTTIPTVAFSVDAIDPDANDTLTCTLQFLGTQQTFDCSPSNPLYTGGLIWGTDWLNPSIESAILDVNDGKTTVTKTITLIFNRDKKPTDITWTKYFECNWKIVKSLLLTEWELAADIWEITSKFPGTIVEWSELMTTLVDLAKDEADKAVKGKQAAAFANFIVNNKGRYQRLGVLKGILDILSLNDFIEIGKCMSYDLP
jgi:hypothetical protein